MQGYILIINFTKFFNEKLKENVKKLITFLLINFLKLITNICRAGLLHLGSKAKIKWRLFIYLNMILKKVK